MVKDERLSKEYIQDIYWDVDLKKAEEDFKNNGYKFPTTDPKKVENSDLEKPLPKKSLAPPAPKIESTKKASATKNKPDGPKFKTSEEGQGPSSIGTSARFWVIAAILITIAFSIKIQNMVDSNSKLQAKFSSLLDQKFETFEKKFQNDISQIQNSISKLEAKSSLKQEISGMYFLRIY